MERLCGTRLIPRDKEDRDKHRRIWGHTVHQCVEFPHYGTEHDSKHRCHCGFQYHGIILRPVTIQGEIMSDQRSEEPNEMQPIRLDFSEFLTQLDTAAEWGLWVHPVIEEVELIVKDSDGKISIFHGPDPMSVSFEEYKQFAAEVDALAATKEI